MFSSAGYKLLMYKVYVTASGAPAAADFFLTTVHGNHWPSCLVLDRRVLCRALWMYMTVSDMYEGVLQHTSERVVAFNPRRIGTFTWPAQGKVTPLALPYARLGVVARASARLPRS